MSSVSSGIAGSVSQANLQQSQVARSRDAKKNERSEQARQMREALEQRLNRVDDSTAIDPAQEQNEQREHQPQPHSHASHDDDPDDDQNPPIKHVDVTA